MRLCQVVVADAGIARIVSSMENHQRVATCSPGWTSIEIANSELVLVIAFPEGSFVVGSARRICRSMSH